MSERSYEIVNLDDVVSDMCDALTDEHLASHARHAKVPISTMREFWMLFALQHLANAVPVDGDKLQNGMRVSADSFLDVYGATLKSFLTDHDFPPILQMKAGKFGKFFVLPKLAELISPDLKEEIIGELGGDLKQLIEG